MKHDDDWTSPPLCDLPFALTPEVATTPTAARLQRPLRFETAISTDDADMQPCDECGEEFESSDLRFSEWLQGEVCKDCYQEAEIEHGDEPDDEWEPGQDDE